MNMYEMELCIRRMLRKYFFIIPIIIVSMVGGIYYVDFYPRVDSDHKYLRIEAVNGIADQQRLAELAIGETYREDVAEHAARQLRDQTLLAKVLRESRQWGAKLVAVGLIEDEDVLKRFFETESNSALRVVALKSISDPVFRASVALKDSDLAVRRAALGNMEDEAALSEMVLHDADPNLRWRAAATLRSMSERLADERSFLAIAMAPKEPPKGEDGDYDLDQAVGAVRRLTTIQGLQTVLLAHVDGWPPRTRQINRALFAAAAERVRDLELLEKVDDGKARGLLVRHFIHKKNFAENSMYVKTLLRDAKSSEDSSQILLSLPQDPSDVGNAGIFEPLVALVDDSETLVKIAKNVGLRNVATRALRRVPVDSLPELVARMIDRDLALETLSRLQSPAELKKVLRYSKVESDLRTAVELMLGVHELNRLRTGTGYGISFRAQPELHGYNISPDSFVGGVQGYEETKISGTIYGRSLKTAFTVEGEDRYTQTYEPRWPDNFKIRRDGHLGYIGFPQIRSPVPAYFYPLTFLDEVLSLNEFSGADWPRLFDDLDPKQTLMRAAIVRQMRSAEKLESIASSDGDAAVRAQAACHVSNQPLLHEIVMRDASEKVRVAAVGSIKKEPILRDILAHIEKNTSTKIATLCRLWHLGFANPSNTEEKDMPHCTGQELAYCKYGMSTASFN